MAAYEIKLDSFTRRILVVLTFLLAVVSVELWVSLPDRAMTAVAQIPDTGLQRQQLVDEARKTNQLLGDILDHLRLRSVKVRMETADKTDRKKSKADQP